MAKLISVIMSVYNSDLYLSDAINSILKQSYTNFEFIIINDGSNDNSFSIINQYKEQDSRIILINQENQGLTKSLNHGVKIAKGEYIARQDADDISMHDRFLNFIRFIEDSDVDIYSTPAYTINETNEIKKIIPNFFRRNGFKERLLDYYNSMVHGTLIVKSEIIKRNLYNENFRFSQDFELYHRLMGIGYNISYDKNNISYKLRIHKDSITAKNKTGQLKLYKSINNSNNKKYYKSTLFNRVYFRSIDVLFFIKEKLK